MFQIEMHLRHWCREVGIFEDLHDFQRESGLLELQDRFRNDFLTSHD